MTKITFKEFLRETPLHDYQTIGDFSKNSSFRDPRDRNIIQHPKAIERTRKKFGNTDFDFDFYFVNSAKANKHTEVGLVTPEWVKDNLGDEVYNTVMKNHGDDHIQVIFTNNKGAERMPMTAWMMAHRIGHALARKGGMRDSRNQYAYASDHLIQQLSNIMSYYGQQNFPSNEKTLSTSYSFNEKGRRNNQLAMKWFFSKVCTFKSARDNNIRDWFEVLNELIAQYLTTGKIKFNKAPERFGGGFGANKQTFYLRDAEEANDILEMLASDMEMLLDDMLSSVANSIMVM